jgi:hypothetical protein
MSDLAVAVARLQEARQSINELRDAGSFQERRIEFFNKLADVTNAVLAAQEERATLLDRIRDLEREIERQEDWKAKEQRYELVSLAPNVVARAPKQGMQATETPHYLCANCFAAKKESYLQQTLHGPYYHRYKCNGCGEELSYDTGAPRQTHVIRDGGGPNSWMGT